jgi:N utilization substance protein B
VRFNVGIKRQARECALQILYQLDSVKEPTVAHADEAIAHFFENFDAPDRARTLAVEIVRGVVNARLALDGLLSRHSPRWKVERMAMVDRNVLRLAAHELQHDAETPARVVIDEAIEIARRYGAEQSAAFVNGVLDSAARELKRLDGPHT